MQHLTLKKLFDLLLLKIELPLLNTNDYFSGLFENLELQLLKLEIEN
jgi:hypothetical protein